MTTTKLTTQRLHKVIQDRICVLSSKVSVAQRVLRLTYDVNTSFKGFYGIMASDNGMINEINEAFKEAGFKVDTSMIERGFLKVARSY